MLATINFSLPERRKNSQGESYSYIKFEIISHDGTVSGEIGVPFAVDDNLVLLEAKWRLKGLLKEALNDIE